MYNKGSSRKSLLFKLKIKNRSKATYFTKAQDKFIELPLHSLNQEI